MKQKWNRKDLSWQQNYSCSQESDTLNLGFSSIWLLIWFPETAASPPTVESSNSLCFFPSDRRCWRQTNDAESSVQLLKPSVPREHASNYCPTPPSEHQPTVQSATMTRSVLAESAVFTNHQPLPPSVTERQAANVTSAAAAAARRTSNPKTRSGRGGPRASRPPVEQDAPMCRRSQNV